MQKLTATYRIVTPMFIGGANHEAETIRPPSFKGVLRFWWRALNWGRFYEANGRDDNIAMPKLHAEEARIFGYAADNNKDSGQGCFLLTIENTKLTSQLPPTVHQNLASKSAARYLGYGVIEAFRSGPRHVEAGQLIRSCINEDQIFTVKLLFKDKVEDSIVEAMKAIGLLGGLGSRTRRGMGSIALESLKLDDAEQWTRPTNEENYKGEIVNLFSTIKRPSVEPPFTAFWENSRIDLLLSSTTPYLVLDEFGKAMLDYRSWGKTTDTGIRLPLPSGKKSEERFDKDHDWYRKPGWRKITANKDFHPLRVVFGLPHNYDSKNKENMVNAANHERRSSPLIFHVHQLQANLFVGVSLYLPAKFLPDGEKIKAGSYDVPANVDWSVNTVITNFLDGKVGHTPTAEDRFPTPPKVKVLP